MTMTIVTIVMSDVQRDYNSFESAIKKHSWNNTQF